MRGEILEGVRVIDLCDDIAGPVAALLLAESGADVVKVEPPGGSPTRALPGFRTWNRSKRSVVLDVDEASGREQLDTLLGAADVLLHQFGPARALELGLDDSSLARRFPGLIVSSVLAWPANHVAADLPVDELLAGARFGLCDEQQGYRDGPILVRAPVGSWCSAYLAATGILARLIARGRTGHAGPAHTSLVQGMMVPMTMHWSRAERPSPVMAAGMPKSTPASLFECADGVWVHIMKSPESPLMDEVLAEMGEASLADDDGEPPAARNRMLFDFDRTRAAFLRRPSQAWLDNFWANDIPAQPALQPGEIFSDEQARVNGYVVELDDPEVGRITVPGLPLTIDPPSRIRSAAPGLGVHTDEVLAEWKPREPSTAEKRDHRALAARRRARARPGQLPRRAVRRAAARRSRRRRDQARVVVRRPDAPGRVVVRRVPARQAQRRARPEVAGDPARPGGAGLVGRHRAPQPPHARGAPARDRRGGTPCARARPRVLPHELVRADGPACRLARVRPAVPVVLRLGGGGRRRREPAHVAPLRLHGPLVRAVLAGRDAARALPPRPHR